MEKYLKTPMETVREWMAEGRLHVSPAEAAEVLQCDQEGLTDSIQSGRPWDRGVQKRTEFENHGVWDHEAFERGRRSIGKMKSQPGPCKTGWEARW